MAKPIYVLNGPNLNLLGSREPEVYGYTTLDDIKVRMEEQALRHGLAIDFRQSNHEGVLIDWIHEARTKASGIIINPAGYGHSSVALLDALLSSTNIPCIEVHLSNIYKRETFRRHSYISGGVDGVICGLGPIGYELALEALARRLSGGQAARGEEAG